MKKKPGIFRNKTRSHNRTGAAAIEFALVLVVLVPFLLGVWEIGRLVNVQQTIHSSAREGARQASTGERSTKEVQEFVLDFLTTSGFTKIDKLAANEADVQSGGKVYVEVKVYDLDGNEKVGMDAKDAQQNYKIEVTTTVLFNDVEFSPTNYFLGEDRTVSATVSWNCMKDIPLKVNQQIPLY